MLKQQHRFANQICDYGQFNTKMCVTKIKDFIKQNGLSSIFANLNQ